MIAVVDNDIIIKAACYSILATLSQVLGGTVGELGILSEARFVVEDAIKAADLTGDPSVALASFAEFLGAATIMDPTDDELQLASELEYAAQHSGQSLNVGESLLCAIVVTRAIPQMVTGDKRAIQAIEALLGNQPVLDPISGRVKCLEQLVRELIADTGMEPLREKICRERIDKALTYIFSCFQQTVPAQSVMDGINSYIADLRGKAPRVLAP